MSAYLWNNNIIYLDNVTIKITCLENFKHSVKKLPSLDFMHCIFFSTIGSFYPFLAFIVLILNYVKLK